MKTLKLLFTGIGRRVELIQAFRQACKSFEYSFKNIWSRYARNSPGINLL